MSSLSDKNTLLLTSLNLCQKPTRRIDRKSATSLFVFPKKECRVDTWENVKIELGSHLPRPCKQTWVARLMSLVSVYIQFFWVFGYQYRYNEKTKSERMESRGQTMNDLKQDHSSRVIELKHVASSFSSNCSKSTLLGPIAAFGTPFSTLMRLFLGALTLLALVDFGDDMSSNCFL